MNSPINAKRLPYWDDFQRHETYLSSLDLAPLVATQAVQRLKHISFLATLDYVGPATHVYSRYDHSIGVAFLAGHCAQSLGYDRTKTRLIAAIALLHDVGHAPFSHVSETLMAERLGRYHESLGIQLVRSEADDVTRQLRSGLRDLGGSMLDGVCEAFGSAYRPVGIERLLRGATSFDTFDGISRTAWALEEEPIDPLKLLDCLRSTGGRLEVPLPAMSLLERFWDLQVRLYRHRIYTQEVLAAEAMMTRALELTLDTNRSAVSAFCRATDRDAWLWMSETPIAHDLAGDVRCKNLYRGILETDPPLVRHAYERIRRAGGRLAFGTRREIEAEVASFLRIKPEQVITHFSFTRVFKSARPPGQLSLFHATSLGSPQRFSIDAIFDMFYSRRVSASRFDIFVPNTVELRALGKAH